MPGFFGSKKQGYQPLLEENNNSEIPLDPKPFGIFRGRQKNRLKTRQNKPDKTDAEKLLEARNFFADTSKYCKQVSAEFFEIKFKMPSSAPNTSHILFTYTEQHVRDIEGFARELKKSISYARAKMRYIEALAQRDSNNICKDFFEDELQISAVSTGFELAQQLLKISNTIYAGLGFLETQSEGSNDIYTHMQSIIEPAKEQAEEVRKQLEVLKSRLADYQLKKGKHRNSQVWQT